MRRILPALLAILSLAPAAAQTWTQLAAPGPPGPRNLLGCWFDGSDPNHGVAAGFYVQAFDLIPFVYTTASGGSTWQYQTPYFAGSFLAARAVIFTSSLNGFLVGGGVARTQDGGTTWDLSADVFTVGGQLSDGAFSSPTHGYAVGQPWNGTGGLFCATVNAGASWSCGNVNDPNPLVAVAPQLTAVVRPSATLLVAGGVASAADDRTLIRSTDDGVTWAATGLTVNVNALEFTSPGTGCAGTDTGILRTIDGGVTWSPVLTTVAAVHKLRIAHGLGFAVADDGSIWSTTNAGASWSAMSNPAQGTALYDLFIVSPQLAYACGSGGTLLRYTGPVPALFADGFETGDTSVWSAAWP